MGCLEQCLGSPSPTVTQTAFLSAVRHPLMCAAGDRGQSLLPSPSGTVPCLLSDDYSWVPAQCRVAVSLTIDVCVSERGCVCLSAGSLSC